MLYDLRTYRCRPGALARQLALYEELGLEPQWRHLGAPLLFAQPDVGDVNSYVHIWVYRDAADRAGRRAAMMADPAWQAYLQATAEAGYLISQENSLLTDVSFFSLPPRG
ncbi:MAG: NIPSNAP family protein [Rhodovibrionaceae bacterium]